MCLKCLSRRPLSFALQCQVKKFSKKITPNNEAGDSDKKDSYIKKNGVYQLPDAEFTS